MTLGAIKVSQDHILAPSRPPPPPSPSWSSVIIWLPPTLPPKWSWDTWMRFVSQNGCVNQYFCLILDLIWPVFNIISFHMVTFQPHYIIRAVFCHICVYNSLIYVYLGLICVYFSQFNTMPPSPPPLWCCDHSTYPPSPLVINCDHLATPHPPPQVITGYLNGPLLTWCVLCEPNCELL